MNTITLADLKTMKACEVHTNLFNRIFGVQAEISAKSLEDAVQANLDLYFLLHSIPRLRPELHSVASDRAVRCSSELTALVHAYKKHHNIPADSYHNIKDVHRYKRTIAANHLAEILNLADYVLKDVVVDQSGRINVIRKGE